MRESHNDGDTAPSSWLRHALWRSRIRTWGLLVGTVLLMSCAPKSKSELTYSGPSSSWLRDRVVSPIAIYILDGMSLDDVEMDLILREIQAGNEHVVIRGGKPIEYENPETILEGIDPEKDVESVQILRGVGAVMRFGPEAEKGVIIFILKQREVWVKSGESVHLSGSRSRIR